MGAIVRNLPAEPWEKGIGPGIVDKKIMGPNDSNFMLMGLAKMEPGVKSPPHRHRYTQIFYFIEGQGQVVVDGQAPGVGPGSVARFVHAKGPPGINPGPGPPSPIRVRGLPPDNALWE